MPEHLPHDIREIIPYERPFDYTWGYILAGLLLLLLAFWLFKKWQKNRKKSKIIIHPLKALYQEIKNHTPPDPFNKKNGVEYFFKLNWYLRKFFEETLKIPATDLTLKELRVPLGQGLSFDNDIVNKIFYFLERSDTIKFSEQEASYKEAEEAYHDVLSWVRKLMPSEEKLADELKVLQGDS